MPSISGRRTTSVLAMCLLPLSGTLFLQGCAGSSKTKVSHSASCMDQFTKAHERFEKGKWMDSKERLSQAITNCPGQPFVEQALFELAESHFMMKNWMEAESEYRSFLSEFPTSATYGETVRFRVAEAKAKQVRGPQRDQTPTHNAIAAFEEFLDTYPDAEKASDAKSEIARLNGILAEKHQQIARLYFRMKEYQAAAIYYKITLQDFGPFIEERDLTLKLTDCYIRLNQLDEAESHLSRFEGMEKDDPFFSQVAEKRSELETARARMAAGRKNATAADPFQNKL